VTFTLPRETTFNVVRLRENIRLGQRIDAVEVDQWTNGGWQSFAQATSIGSCRLIRTTDDIRTTRVRLRVTRAATCPALSEFGLYIERSATP
jgi:alpha-L-fucosidase